jgi:hypothetical protein
MATLTEFVVAAFQIKICSGFCTLQYTLFIFPASCRARATLTAYPTMNHCEVLGASLSARGAVFFHRMVCYIIAVLARVGLDTQCHVPRKAMLTDVPVRRLKTHGGDWGWFLCRDRKRDFFFLLEELEKRMWCGVSGVDA